MMRTIPPNVVPDGIIFDFDFLHPSKLNAFYECDTYSMYERGARLPFYETNDRKTLYYAGIKFLYENEDIVSQSEFNYAISGIRVKGYSNDDKKTEAMFAQHISCELKFDKQSIFHIDTRWYLVKNNYIENINELCISMLNSNYLEKDILPEKWEQNKMDEDEYNLQYFNKPNYIVLDKMLGQNIELCDVIYEEKDTIYLIHVKKGFDAKIRDLSNQISISASRLWNDIHASSSPFLQEVLRSYNTRIGKGNEIDFYDFINELHIIKMAFRSPCLLTNG